MNDVPRIELSLHIPELPLTNLHQLVTPPPGEGPLYMVLVRGLNPPEAT